MSKKSPLQRACDMVGGQNALARAIGRKQSTIWSWLQTRVPAEACADIQTATAGLITREQLRPDIFGSRAA